MAGVYPPHWPAQGDSARRVALGWLPWAHERGVTLRLIEPGKPNQNAYIESFNGRFRDECLSLEWFRNRTDATIVIEQWRRDYNTVRPHMSLGYLTPAEFKLKASTTDRSAVLQ